MTAYIDVVLFNVACSTCLAMLAWMVSRRLRRPILAHTLWFLVLLKLVTPPVLGLEGIPRLASSLARPGTLSRANTAQPHSTETNHSKAFVASPQGEHVDGGSQRLATPAVSPTPENVSVSGVSTFVSGVIQAVRSADGQVVGKLFLCMLLSGTLWVASLTALRAWRFGQRLQTEPEAPLALRARAAELARTLDVPHLPRIRLVSQPIPPSLWPRFWSCEILLPAHLLPRLTQDERDMLIAHELAHVRRRDHWIRPFEQLVLALYWWNPIAWWARRQLRVEEEKSCDALVLEKLPRQARAYAQGLLKSIEFLAAKPRLAPALATGAGSAVRLEERMKAILSWKTGKRDSRLLRMLFILPAAVTLLLAPAWVGNSVGVDQPEVEKQASDSMKMHREQLLLQKELREIEVRHVQVQMQIEAVVQERERLRLREEMKRLEQEGRAEEAEALRLQIARTEREATFNRQRAQQELEYSQKREALEFQLQELSLQREELLLRGDSAKADELLESAREIEMQLRRLELEALRNDLERRRQLLEFSQQELEGLSKP